MEGNWRNDYARYKGFYLNILEITRKRQDIRMFLEVLLTLSTTIVFVTFALKPTLITITELIKEIDSKNEIKNQMDNKITNLKKANALLISEKNRISLLDTAVPVGPAPDTFSKQIEGTTGVTQANLMGLSIDEVVLKGTSKTIVNKGSETLPGGARGLVFSVNSNGLFSSLSQFISYLETMRRPISFDTLNINKTLTEETEQINLNVTGQVPFVDNEPVKEDNE